MLRTALLLTVVTALTAAPATGASTPRLYQGKCKPKSYCPANHTCFSGASWTSWGTSRASARADARTQYPGGEPVKGRIRFVFSRPRNMCGGRYYTRARWRVRGDSRDTVAYFESSFCGWTGA